MPAASSAGSTLDSVLRAGPTCASCGRTARRGRGRGSAPISSWSWTGRAPAPDRGRRPPRDRGPTAMSETGPWLVELQLPGLGEPATRPELPVAGYPERIEARRARMARRGYDRLIVFADREHSASMSFLTGFDPRFEEAILIIGSRGDPALVVGNESHAMAGSAPLPVRRHLFQDFSLPSQPRDRSRSLAEIFGDEGVAR